MIPSLDELIAKAKEAKIAAIITHGPNGDGLYEMCAGTKYGGCVDRIAASEDPDEIAALAADVSDALHRPLNPPWQESPEEREMNRVRVAIFAQDHVGICPECGVDYVRHSFWITGTKFCKEEDKAYFESPKRGTTA